MSAHGDSLTSSQHNIINQQPMPPRPPYYITRSNGTYVPLIPADELPFSVRLQGVPRVLNSDQIFGLQQVAVLPYTGSTYQLQNESSTLRSSMKSTDLSHIRGHSTRNTQGFRPNVSNREASASSHVELQSLNPPRETPPHELATNWRRTPTSDPQAVIDAIIGTRSGAEAAARIGYQSKPPGGLPPSGMVPNYDNKEYCTYWIRHGDCDYMQQGCLYKHEMPDRAGLQKLGFSHTPRWYLEKTQTIKLRGADPTFKSSMSSSAWLQSINKKEQSDESGCGGEASDSASTTDESILEDSSAETRGKITSDDTKTTRQSMDNHDDRKLSFGGDLIKFEPLLPTPASSVTSTRSPSSSDTISGDSMHCNTIKATDMLPNSEKHKSRAKVFVPRGESSEFHLARANGKTKRKEPKAAGMDHQDIVPQPSLPAQQPQKVCPGNGLMASKHAPKSHADSKQAKELKTILKSKQRHSKHC